MTTHRTPDAPSAGARADGPAGLRPHLFGDNDDDLLADFAAWEAVRAKRLAVFAGGPPGPDGPDPLPVVDAYEWALAALVRHHAYSFEGLRRLLEVAAWLLAEREINPGATDYTEYAFPLICNAIRAIADSTGEIPPFMGTAD